MLKIVVPALLAAHALLVAGCGSAPSTGSSPAGGEEADRIGERRSGATYGLVSCRKSAKLVSLPEGRLQLQAERRCNPLVATSFSEGTDVARSWLKSECPEVHAEWYDARVGRDMDCRIASSDLIDLSSQASELAPKKPRHCDTETLEVQPLMVVCQPR